MTGTSQAAQRAAETEKDLTVYLSKTATTMQQEYLDWLLEKLELDVNTAFKSKGAAFAEGVRLGVALRGIHQASPENQERLRLMREAAAERAAETPDKPVKATKAAAPKAAAPPVKATKAPKAAAPVEPEEEETEAAPARRPAKRTTGRRAPATTTVTAEAPF